jgi:hypothetical protein
MITQVRPNSAPRFGLDAWFVLIFVILLNVLSLAQIIYRFTLPTDGWIVATTVSLDNPNWIYYVNLAGATSDLRQGDELLAVDEVSVQGIASFSTADQPARWVPGQHVTMTILRDNKQLSIDVPVINWSFTALWHNLTSLTGVVGASGTLIMAAVGLFTFWQRSELPAARALLVLCMASLATTISGLLPDGLSTQFNALASNMTGFYSYAIFGIVLGPSLLAFSLNFPNPKRVTLHHRWSRITAGDCRIHTWDRCAVQSAAPSHTESCRSPFLPPEVRCTAHYRRVLHLPAR